MDYMHYNLVCFFMNPPALHGQKNINADNKDRERERERDKKGQSGQRSVSPSWRKTTSDETRMISSVRRGENFSCDHKIMGSKLSKLQERSKENHVHLDKTFSETKAHV